MPVPSQITELVERFHRNLDLYKRQSYREARVRIEFIDPFFEALGWDVCNVQQRSRQWCPLFPSGRPGCSETRLRTGS